MKKSLVVSVLGVSLVALSCTSNVETNPLLTEWDNEYGLPPFEKIKESHYLSAFNFAIKQDSISLNSIINSADAPTFENTIVSLDTMGSLLRKISGVFFPMTSSGNTLELKEVQKEVFPLLSSHNDDIILNEKLFSRVKSVFLANTKDGKNIGVLSPEDYRLLTETYNDFAENGANLSPEDKDKLRALNLELSKLAMNFGNNILSDKNKFQLVIEDSLQLKGLPTSVITGALQNAKAKNINGHLFTLDKSSMIPFLQNSAIRELRIKLYDGYLNIANNGGEFDNKTLVESISNLRLEKAKLLGFSSHSQMVLSKNMSKNIVSVNNLLDNILTPALNVGNVELQDIKAEALKDGIKDLHPSDWWFYSEKIRSTRFAISDQIITPYFPLNGVRDGIFTLCNKLYDLTFEPLSTFPKFHKDLQAYKVMDKSTGKNTLLGILYMDFHPRDTKRSGAWMTSFRKQGTTATGEREIPLVSITCNFTPPLGDSPALLTPDETNTFFHEFGHALHGLLSNVKYQSLSGTAVVRDFVELPSQIMEHWAFETDMLKSYAKHYKTGEVIPDTLIAKLDASSQYGQGFATLEYLAAAMLDLKYHSIEEPAKIDPLQTELALYKEKKFLPLIAPRYRSTYFNHIFAGGYSSGYYAYIWAEVLDADAYQAFKEKGDIFSKEVATRFRKEILEKGNSQDPSDMYIKFRGKEASIEALLQNRGLK